MVSKILKKHSNKRNKQINWTSSKIASLHFKGYYQESENTVTEWDKIFVNLISKNDLYPEYIEDPYNSITKKDITQFKKCAKNLDRHVLKEDTQMVNKHKKMSQYHVVLGNAHSNHKGYHFVPTKIITLKKADNKTYW